MRCWLAALLTVALTAQQPAPPVPPVAFEVTSTRHIAISVRINDSGPYRMIFDTGSPVVLVNAKVAREARIAASTREVAGAKLNWPGQMVAKSITIGDAKAEQVPVAVLDHPTLKAMEGMIGQVDGIIGFPFFARFATSVDYSTRQLTFAQNGHKPEDALQSIMTSMRKRNSREGQSLVAPAAQWGIVVAKSDDQAGVLISNVYENGAAARAGIQVGDRLLSIDGRWTDTEADCFQSVSQIGAGNMVEVRIRRNNLEKNISITPKAGF